MVLSTIVVPLSFKPGLDRLGVGEVNRNGGEGAGWWLGRCGCTTCKQTDKENSLRCLLIVSTEDEDIVTTSLRVGGLFHDNHVRQHTHLLFIFQNL